MVAGAPLWVAGTPPSSAVTLPELRRGSPENLSFRQYRRRPPPCRSPEWCGQRWWPVVNAGVPPPFSYLFILFQKYMYWAVEKNMYWA